MSGPSYNAPAQPTYGEGMADAMKAQMEQLLGQGDFADIYANAGFAGGNLGDIIREVEAPLRQQTAQTDTDVLRQTLLGNQREIQVERDPDTGKFGIAGAEVQREIIEGTANYRLEENFTENTNGRGVVHYRVIDNDTDEVIQSSFLKDVSTTNPVEAREELLKNKSFTKYFDDVQIEKIKNPNTDLSSIEFEGKKSQPQTAGGGRYQMVQLSEGQEPESMGLFGNRGDPNAYFPGTTPKFAIIDTDTGGIAGESGGTPFLREGMSSIFSGAARGEMLNTFGVGFEESFENVRSSVSEEASLLELGTTSAVTEFNKLREAIDTGGEEAVAQEFTFENPYTGEPLEEGQTVTIRDEDGMIDLLGDRRNVQEFATRQATQEDVDAGLASEVGDSITEQVGNRQAGFDESGEFLGLSAMAEDIQRGNLSRQREADLADVERLSGRFQSVMEDYKPAATSGIQGAKDLIEEQKEKLTSGDPTITDDIADTYGGDVTGQTMTAATVADPLQLSANTQFDQQLGREGDTLRQALLGDARTALDSGLTEREQANISNAARARSTLMGRTFDQSGAIEEAQALVAEDNNRLMQNRGFAQSVMGQEAGLQQGDITRGMAQESEQAGLQQQANLAQAQMDQQASAFDAQSAQQANVVNQGQAQQAAQFGVGATMDAERLNEQLRQQGLGNYINAVGNLAQIEDQHTLDPFQALLGRTGGGSLQAGQGVFGQASYGLNSGPQYLNPEAGLGYISQMSANDANMYAAQVGADAARFSGLMSGLGSLGGGAFAGAGAAGGFGSLLCWVAREVYGPTNPAWLQFREWMLTESPGWFFKLYRDYGERFANWVSDKPRIKSIIRKWMDSKIRR